MLALTRRVGEEIVVGDPKNPLGVIRVVDIHGDKVRLAFDFPRDIDHVHQEITTAGMEILDLCDGKITFHYDTPEEVLQHLLKSGAGTAFYEAIDLNKRAALKKEFLKRLADRRRNSPTYDVSHDYFMCIARKP